MKLLGSTKNKIIKEKNGENAPHVEITAVVLVHCIIANNDYQLDLRVLYTFVANKLFGQLVDISRNYFISLKIFSLEFSCIKVWFTDRNSKPLEIEDKISITLVFNERVTYKNDTLFN